MVPAAQRCEGKANTSLLNAIDRALRVDEGERPQTIAEWRQVLAEGGKSVRNAVTQPAEGAAMPRDGLSWSSRALVAVIVVLLGTSAWQGWNLYRGAPDDSVGETAAVVEQQADTQFDSQADVALGTQKNNEMETAPRTAGAEAGQPATDPEAFPPAEEEYLQGISDPDIKNAFDILLGILGRSDNPDEKERLEQAVLDMTPDKRDAWYTGVQAIIRQLTLDIQNLLTALGYNSGTADGIYSEKTEVAIEAFQQDMGIPVDGQISRQLLHTLRQELVARQGKNAGTTDTGPTQESTPIFTGFQEEYFTRGSHEDDVLRLQGTPLAIGSQNWDSTGEKLLFLFGDHSSVTVDPQTRRVLEWDNTSGNLKVRLSPGNQVTSEAYFTRGSHEDDVLRLQGTPSSIFTFETIETWSFGDSSVLIDSQTRLVFEWVNNGNLKVKL